MEESVIYKAPPPLRKASIDDLYDYDRFPLIQASGTGEMYRSAYNRKFPPNSNDLQIEMWCCARRLTQHEGGLGEFGHFRRCVELLYPYMANEWHHWLDMNVDMFTGKSGTCTMLGGGGIGKSWALGTFAHIWQACSPKRRGVMIINTTQKSQSERAWRYVIDCHQDFPFLPGVIAASKTEPRLDIYEEIQDPRDPKKTKLQKKPSVGIISQTVKKGTSAQATADLKGMHPDELLVIIEEANHLKRRHLERARANWITNRYYKILLVGNPDIEDKETDSGKEDALYHFSEPIHGWDAIEWGTDRVWENKFGGKTYHFDPYDSPRIHNPKKFQVSVWLPDETYIQEKARELGGENNALFKQQIRGIYDHESLPFSPITRSMCHRFNTGRAANFIGMHRQRWAAFDPAYSGSDEAFLKIAESGMVDDGRMVVDFLGEKTNFVFRIDSSSGEEASFQMLRWVKELLAEWGVPYRNLIMDANIIGIGLGDIFQTYLSKEITRVGIMGQPTDRPLDVKGELTAKDRCVNRQSEFWVAFQLMMITEQIRGLDDTIISQLADMTAELVNGKIKVLDKKKFRERYGYSPDRAECVLFILDLLRDRGMRKGVDEAALRDAVVGDSHGGFHGNVIRPEDVFVNRGMVPYTERRSEEEYDRILQGRKGRTIQSSDVADFVDKIKRVFGH